VTVAGAIAERYDAARTDAGLVQTALFVEQLGALAYAAAASGVLTGADRARAERFAAQEREHAAALATMLLALTVPVRVRATEADVAELMPGLDRDPRRALELLAELEGAAIAGHQVLGRRLRALDILRTVGMVMGGAAQHLVVLRAALDRRPLSEVFESGR
jgi:rubrerythrin